MKKMVEDVTAFHERYKQPVAEIVGAPAQHRTRFRSRLVREEAGELCEALDRAAAWYGPHMTAYGREKQVEAIARECVDLLYVVVGTALEFGFANKLEELWAEVHRANMTKVSDGRGGKPTRPPGFKDARIREVLYGKGTDER